MEPIHLTVTPILWAHEIKRRVCGTIHQMSSWLPYTFTSVSLMLNLSMPLFTENENIDTTYKAYPNKTDVEP